jgi:hypothetical protein
MTTYLKILASMLLATSTGVLAQQGTSLESDWLELVKGHKGETLGVELRDIEAGDSEGTQKITLAVPKESIAHPDEIEEVVVIGRKPDDPEPIDIKYEWLDDYDNDNYGLVIHIGESNWPIRLYMNSSSGFIR